MTAFLIKVFKKENREIYREMIKMDEMEWLQAAAANPAFEFLKNPAEEIYKTTDGKPFQQL